MNNIFTREECFTSIACVGNKKRFSFFSPLVLPYPAILKQEEKEEEVVVKWTKVKHTHSGHTLRHPFEHQLKY
jgi:hypothetical protein